MWRRSRSRPARRLVAALPPALGSPPSVSGGALVRARFAALCGALACARLAALCGALAHARFAALWRRSRSRSARRFGAALPPAPGSPLSISVRRFPAAAKALCATFRRRSRSRPARCPLFPAVLPLAPGSPLRYAALAHARLAALWRRSRPRPARRFGAALSPALGSPLRCGALARARFAASVRRSRSARFAALCFRRRFPAAAKTLCATFGAALAHARFAALWRRSRSRSVRRFVAALSLTLGSPLCGGGFRLRQRLFVRPFGGALARARLARAQSRAQKMPALFFLSTGSRLKYP